MRLGSFRQRFGTLAFLLSALAALAMALGQPASAGTGTGTGTTSKDFSSIAESIGCLSPSLCIVSGYNDHETGDVTPVRGGSPGEALTVKGTESIGSISCPSAKGCVALGVPKSGAGLSLIPISGSGKPEKPIAVKIAALESFDRIDCSSSKSCVLAGFDLGTKPESITIGVWNGKKLTTRKVNGIAGSTGEAVEGLSCDGGSCLLVGYAEHTSKITGFLLPIHHGKPASSLIKAPGASLYGSACVSASSCEVVGYDKKGGLIDTVHDGKIVKTKGVKPDLDAIACHASGCTAAGDEIPSDPTSSGFEGVVISLADGSVKSTTPVPDSGGFIAVARPSSGVYAATGGSTSIKDPSEVTTG